MLQNAILNPFNLDTCDYVMRRPAFNIEAGFNVLMGNFALPRQPPAIDRLNVWLLSLAWFDVTIKFSLLRLAIFKVVIRSTSILFNCG